MLATTAYFTRGLQLLLGSSKRAVVERAEEMGAEDDDIPLTESSRNRPTSEASSITNLATNDTLSVQDRDITLPSRAQDSLSGPWHWRPTTIGTSNHIPPITTNTATRPSTSNSLSEMGCFGQYPPRYTYLHHSLPLHRSPNLLRPKLHHACAFNPLHPRLFPRYLAPVQIQAVPPPCPHLLFNHNPRDLDPSSIKTLHPPKDPRILLNQNPLHPALQRPGPRSPTTRRR